MKTSLSHLPQVKQEQILQIVEIIKEVTAPENYFIKSDTFLKYLFLYPK